MTLAEKKVIRAALSWWRGRRPVGWSKRRHQRTPFVNCVTKRDHELARAIRFLLGERDEIREAKKQDAKAIRKAQAQLFRKGK